MAVAASARGVQGGAQGRERRLKDAINAVSVGHNTPDPGTLNDPNANWKKLSDTLDASVRKFSPGEYIAARCYLKLLGNTVTALKGGNASLYFNDYWTAKGRNVSELVPFLANKELWFAAAKPGDEPAYLALCLAMATFDASIPDLNDAGRSRPVRLCGKEASPDSVWTGSVLAADPVLSRRGSPPPKWGQTQLPLPLFSSVLTIRLGTVLPGPPIQRDSPCPPK